MTYGLPRAATAVALVLGLAGPGFAQSADQQTNTRPSRQAEQPKMHCWPRGEDVDRSELRTMFERLDDDADGEITLSEMKSCLQRHDVQLDQPEQAFRDADRDGNERLAQAEFLRIEPIQTAQLTMQDRQQDWTDDQAARRGTERGETSRKIDDRDTVEVDQQPMDVQVDHGQTEVEVDEKQAEVVVDQKDPKITVQSRAPEVEVKQRDPEVTVEQPEPDVRIDQAKPDVKVKQAEPEVKVTQADPDVTVEGTDDGARQDRQNRQDRDRQDQDRMQQDGRDQTGRTDRSIQFDGSNASWRPEELVGQPIYAMEGGDEIGDIEEIVADPEDNSIFAVVAMGGFLGLGERKVLLPMKDLAMRDGMLMTAMSKREMRQNGYKKEDWDRLASR